MRPNYRIYAMSQAYTFVQALLAAGDEPTRESSVTAVQAQGASFEGPLTHPGKTRAGPRVRGPARVSRSD